jgi:hypothetical protein
LDIYIVRTLPTEDWRRFVDGHPHGNIFHTPEIFQVFARTRGYRPELWAAVTGDSQIMALLLPVQVTLGGNFTSFMTTRSVAYGSVLHDLSPTGEEGLAVLLNTYVHEVGHKTLFTELRNLSDLSPIQPVLNQHGFIYEDHLNYLLNLDCSPDDILRGIGRRTRKHIRRGLRSGEVVIKEIVGREQISLCYDLLRKTYATAQVPLADQSLFGATFDTLYPRGMVKFFTAWIGEACVATSVDLVYKDTIYGWYGSVDREYIAYMPNELLMWHILQWGSENGYHVYDFGGAGKPNEKYGVRDFKAKFGGRLVNYGRNIRIHARWRMGVSVRTYQLARKALLLLKSISARHSSGNTSPETETE